MLINPNVEDREKKRCPRRLMLLTADLGKRQAQKSLKLLELRLIVDSNFRSAQKMLLLKLRMLWKL